MFFDTNILVYAQQSGEKAARAQDLLAQGGCVSVQVLNELANVLCKKFSREWREIEEVLDDLRDLLDDPLALTYATHRGAVALAGAHKLSIYDALIVVAAQEGGCTLLISEDLQHGRRFGELTVQNPFL
ncbi:PIN domain-containing protein [Rhodoblastus sp.]|uniref:PIN domain-containing protein n=1 Tax=Rhodoblastus sp. TaxID=1962975 RepID=UPI003F9BE2DF